MMATSLSECRSGASRGTIGTDGPASVTLEMVGFTVAAVQREVCAKSNARR